VSVQPQRWQALVFIAIAQLMIALDATVVNIAMPSAQAALGFSDADRQWIVTAYTLAFGGLLLLGGRVSDSARVGRRRAFLIGLVGFAAASALSGAAINLETLVVARALQGACAALLAPTALSLLAVMFTGPAERARAFGIYGAIAASGGAMGLLLGGVLTQYLEWRWCLYINAPIALLAAVGARAVVYAPRASGASRAERLDLLGLLLGSGGLVALVYASAQVPGLGWSAPQVLADFGVGVLALGLFVWHQARTAAPLLPLHIVLDRQRGAAYASALFAIAGIFGAFLFLTYELQVVLGFTPLQAGVAFLPMSASSFVAATLVAPRLLPRVSARTLMVPGFISAAIGMSLLTQVRLDSAYIAAILPAEILLGLGIACVMVPASSIATSRINFQDAGIASAVLNSAQQIGAALGTAGLNSVAAVATASYLMANITATRPEGLVHGYAAAAIWGAFILVCGAGIAFWVTNRQADVRMR
jgi:EmrB/QacA subfamily drug resistance transporter